MLASVGAVSPGGNSSSIGVFMKKMVLIGLVLALVLAFFAFDLNQALTLDGLKAGLGQIKTLRTESPVMVALVQTAASLPVFLLPDVPLNLQTLQIILPYALTLAVVSDSSVG